MDVAKDFFTCGACYFDCALDSTEDDTTVESEDSSSSPVATGDTVIQSDASEKSEEVEVFLPRARSPFYLLTVADEDEDDPVDDVQMTSQPMVFETQSPRGSHWNGVPIVTGLHSTSPPVPRRQTRQKPMDANTMDDGSDECTVSPMSRDTTCVGDYSEGRDPAPPAPGARQQYLDLNLTSTLRDGADSRGTFTALGSPSMDGTDYSYGAWRGGGGSGDGDTIGPITVGRVARDVKDLLLSPLGGDKTREGGTFV